MEVFQTHDEIESYLNGRTASYLSFQRKKSTDTLHEGHKKLIEYSRTISDLTIVGFWHIFDELYPFYENDPYLTINRENEIWDEEGALNWCSNNGVDIVLLPTFNYIYELVQNKFPSDLNEAKVFIENVFLTEDYPNVSEPTDVTKPTKYLLYLRVKGWCLWKYYMNQKYNIISSWKDGYLMFIRKHFLEKYTQNKLFLIDPIISEDKLFYSSVYFTLTDQEKNDLSQIPNFVKSIDYTDEEDLLVKLNNKLFVDCPFKFTRVEIFKNNKFIGENNIFIHVYFSCGDKLDNYPIYIRNGE